MTGPKPTREQMVGRMLARGSETTPLTPEQELAFQQWVRRNGITDVDHPQSRYDYRGAFLAGMEPDAASHWPDTFKQHGHPLFSAESKYANDPANDPNWYGEMLIRPFPRAANDATRVKKRQ